MSQCMRIDSGQAQYTKNNLKNCLKCKKYKCRLKINDNFDIIMPPKPKRFGKGGQIYYTKERERL